MFQVISTEELTELNAQFEDRSPQDVLKWAFDTYGDNFAVVTSFQPTGIVTLHMLSEIAPKTPILTLDTGLLFTETYALMDDLESRLNLNLHRITAEFTVAQQATAHGDKLWEHDPDRCCDMRKTVPLKNALEGYSAWVTGLRRDQSSTRAYTPFVTWDSRNNMMKLCPFATWTEEMIWTYIHAYELPYNDLHDRGYPTIGCYPCTQAVLDGDDPRAGRWSNHNKTECGIHFVTIETSHKSEEENNE